ncbi:hypothetical protein [Streptomyces cyaneofuscatus]|uniref:hypothetical protein n=1 Tax=Streptomyces cyaneofuscatus TaxID=66883 RepID=UPI00342E1E72
MYTPPFATLFAPSFATPFAPRDGPGRAGWAGEDLRDRADGQLLDATGWSAQQLLDGALLICETGMYGPGGRSDYAGRVAVRAAVALGDSPPDAAGAGPWWVPVVSGRTGVVSRLGE